MVLVIFLMIGWISILVFVLLPHKIPAVSNALLYMGLSIVDINRLTAFSFMYHFIHIRTDLTHFLSFILYRDISSAFLLLIMVNLFFVFDSLAKRIATIIICFSFYFGLSQLAKAFEVYTYVNWSILNDTLALTIVMVIALGMGYISLRIVKKRAA